MRRLARLLPLLALASLGGCSLTGFDEVAAQPCLAEGSTDFVTGNARCREIEAEKPSDDACLAWVCALQIDDERFCVLAPPDDDDDGVGAAMCVMDESADQDCDDANAAITGRAGAEVCDGLDNDCDEAVDENTFALTDAVLVGSGTAASRVTFGRGLDPVAAFRQSDELVFQRGDVAPVPTGVTLRAAPGPGLAVAQAAAEPEVFVAYVPRGGCQAVTVGTGTAESWTNIPDGLPDGEGRDCSDAERGGTVAQPGLAAHADTLLAAWLGGQPAAACGAAADTEITVAGAGTDLAPRGSGVVLGGASSLVTPALLALGGDEYLVAWSSGAAVEVRRVQVGASGLSTEGLGSASISRSARELHLALSIDGTRALLGIVGCDDGAAQVLELGDGLALGPSIAIGADRNATAPRVIASPAQSGFLVAWLQGSAVFSELVQPDEASAGAVGPTTRLVEGGVSEGFELTRGTDGLSLRYYGALGGTDGFVDIGIGCGP